MGTVSHRSVRSRCQPNWIFICACFLAAFPSLSVRLARRSAGAARPKNSHCNISLYRMHALPWFIPVRGAKSEKQKCSCARRNFSQRKISASNLKNARAAIAFCRRAKFNAQSSFLYCLSAARFFSNALIKKLGPKKTNGPRRSSEYSLNISSLQQCSRFRRRKLSRAEQRI